MKSHEASASARSPRSHRARRVVGAVALTAIAMLGGACGAGRGEGQARPTAPASAQPETPATPSPEAKPNKLIFDPEVLDALRTVSAATTCEVTGVKDLGGAGRGEGTAGVAGGVELSLTYTTKADADKAAAVVAAGSNTQATGGALAAYATGTQDGQKREQALVHLSAAAGIASAVPIDVANPPAVEVFEPNGQWSAGSRVTLKYTHFASAEKLDATDTQAVMVGTEADCAGSFVFDGTEWSFDATPPGQPSESLMNQCGGQGAALAVCDPMEAYRQVR